MIKSRVLIAIAAMTLAIPAAYTSGKRSPRMLSLCELVNNWKDYNRQKIRVRAIFSTGAEQSVLYDPACRDGKDLTYAEIHARATGKAELNQVLTENKRAWVEIEGVFCGPELYTDVDPKLPAAIRERLETSPRHYGHMASMDTMISITRIFKVQRVSDKGGPPDHTTYPPPKPQ